MEELEKLYNVLKRDGYYTKSFEEFQVQSEDLDYQQKLYDVVSRDGLYTNSKEEFESKYFLKKKEPSQPIVEEEVMVSDTTVVEQPGSSDVSDPNVQPEVIEEEQDSIFTEPEVVEEPEVIEEPEVVEEETALNEFDKSMKVIDLDLMSAGDKSVAPILDYHFKDYGFEFESAGMLQGDRITVTASNGNTIEIETDNIRDKKDLNEGEKLKTFLNQNKPSENNKVSTNLLNEYQQNKKKYFSKDDIKVDLKSMNKLAKEQADRIRTNLANQYQFAQMKEEYKGMSQADIDANPEFIAEYEQLKDFLTKQNDALKFNDAVLTLKGAELDRNVGEYYEAQAQKGTNFGGFINAFLSGVGRETSGYTNIALDIASATGAGRNPNFKDDPIYREKFTDRALATGLWKGDKERILSNWDQWSSTISEDQFDEVDDYIMDRSMKEQKYGEDRENMDRNPFSMYADKQGLDPERGMLDFMRTGIVEVMGTDESTKEWADLKKTSFWGGALLGLTESLPAMMAGGKGAWAQRTAQMYGQVSDHVIEQMENDPGFNDITEGQKAALVMPLGAVVATLEAFGLRNVLAQKGIAQSILLRIVKKNADKSISKALASGVTFNQIVRREVSNMIVKGGLVVTSAGLAEFETGFLQEGADIAAKEVFNAVMEDEYFQAPENILGQMVYAGAQEAVGGFILGTPGAISTAASTYDFTELDKGVFEMFESIHTDEVIKDAYVQRIKDQILKGEKTKEQGQKEIDQYNEVVGVMSQIPTDFTSDQKKRALGILLRTQELKNQIEGKDSRLVRKKQEEIDSLNQDLDNILYEEQDAKKEEVTVTDEEARASLEKDNNINSELEKRGLPNSGQQLISDEAIQERKQELIKDKQDAVQESSTAKVDVQESTQDSSQMGERDSGQTTIESQDVTETSPETTTQEEVDPEVEQESKDLEQFLDGEVTEDTEVTEDQDGSVFEKIDEVVSINRANKPVVKKNKFKDYVIKKAKRAAKAIKIVAPNVKIVLHESAQDYFDVTKKRGQGTFLNNTIHINLEIADKSTVAHEAFHGILLSKLKTDAAAGRVTKKMMESISKSLSKDSNLKKKIDAFVSNYDENIQNEEALAQIIGEIAAGYRQLDNGSKSVVRKWIDRILKGLGIEITEFTKSDKDVINLLNTIARKVTTGQEIQEGEVELIDQLDQGTDPIGNPTEIKSPSKKSRDQIDFKQSYDMSLVTPKNKIDLMSLIDDIIKNDKKVWFWVADQLGLGNGMDAGPSFALQPENIKKGAIWASGLDEKKLNKNITAADFIFIISGSPETSKLFNKKVFDAYANKLGDYDTFKKKALEINPTKAIKETLEEFDSWPAMRRSPKRKTFLIAVNEQSKKPNTKFHALVNTLGGFVDLQSLRDGFYKENEFAQNDIMMVLKPSGLGGKSNHSTYTYDILGEVVGVPDIKLNAEEIMPEAIKAKIEGKGISEQTSSIAPFGGATPTAVKSITKPAAREQKDVITKEDVEILYPAAREQRSFNFTQAEVDAALQNDKRSREIIAKGLQPKEGEKVGIRLNLNVLKNTGIPIQTVHKGDNSNYKKVNGKAGFFSGQAINYAPAVTLKDVYFNTNQVGIYKIKNNITNKTPVASVDGQFQNVSLADTNFDGVEIRFNPMSGGLFVTVDGGKPVRSVEEATIVGHRVYARGKVEYFTESNQPKPFTPTQAWLDKNPSKKPAAREQKDVFKNNMSPTEIIIAGRENNFTDASIKDYLVKVRKETVKAVNELLSIKKDLFSKMPPSFGDVKKGAKSGARLYSRVLKRKAKLQGDNNLTNNEVMDKLIEFLQAQPEYIAEGQKGGLTVQQAKMESELQKETGIRPSKNMSGKIRAARQLIRNSNRTKKNLQAIKRELRNFVRASLPKDVYTKSEVMDLVRKITDADANNIDRLMDEVETFVMKRTIRDLEGKIDKLLDPKNYVKTQGKRKAGKGVSVEVAERLQRIANFVADYKNTGTAEALFKLNETLLSKFNDLAKKPEPTEAEVQEMVDLEIAMSLVSSEIMRDNVDIRRINELDKAESALAELVEFGKTNLKEEINKAREKYQKEFAIAYQAIRNDKDILDMNDPETIEMLRDQEVLDKQDSNSKKVKTRLAKWSLSLKNLLASPFNALADLTTLMNHIDMMPGDLFGGELQTLVTDKIDASSRKFKGRMIAVEKVIINKLVDIYGKKWAKETRSLRESKPTGIIIENKAGKKELILSQNQMYYYYNQYKDSSNHPAFETTFGKNYVEVMEKITAQLDPRVKQFADWQVNELFPALYNEYNKTYRAIYRTNMPWNKFYAGMLYKDGQKEDSGVLNLLGDGNPFGTSVGSGSTIARQKNSKAILDMDGTDALFTYLRNMEYFSAYAESIRDVNKLFTNEYIKKTIVRLHGQDIYNKIETIIQRVASKGIQTQQSAKFLNWMNNAFILSRLGLNPLLMIKQLTSVFTYSNDIGVVNWMKFGAGLANVPKMVRTWKEIGENSVYMQDRKYQSITKVIESYSDSSMQEFIPSPTKDKIVNMMMFFTKTGDKAAIMIGGMPNYLYYKDQALKQGKTEEQAIKEAIVKFERDTKRTQQSSDIQDKDVLQTGDPLYRALNMFLTTPKQYMRKEMQAFTNLNRKLMAWDRKAGKGTVGENVRTLAMYHVFMPVLFQFITNGMPGLLSDWEDEDEADLLRASIIGNLNALFIIGDAITALGDVATGKPWAGQAPRNTPIVAMALNIGKQWTRINTLKDPEKKADATKKMVYEMLSVGGIPASNIDKIANNVIELIDGGESPEKVIMRLLNYSEYQIKDKEKKKKKPKKAVKLTKKEMKLYDPEAYYQMMLEEKQYEAENYEYLYEQKLQKELDKRERQRMLNEMYR